MSHEVKWTKRTTDFFLENSNATEFEKQVLLTRISGMSIVQQSYFFSCSTATISRAIKKLKILYDEVQREYPEELRPRKTSVYETYLDEH